LERKFKGNDQKDLTISSTESGSRDPTEESVEFLGATGRKRVKPNEEEQRQNTYYPFINQNQPFPSLSSIYNPYSFPQFPSINYPFGEMNTYKNMYGGYVNTMSYNSVNPFMHQAMINYPLFCMPFQPTFSVDMFQQQA
jgi:hypothetical protein